MASVSGKISIVNITGNISRQDVSGSVSIGPVTLIIYDLTNYFADHTDTYLNTPSQSDPWDSTSIHAGIIDMLLEHGLSTWNGYRYWMAHSPFPPDHPVDPSHGENPEILVSNDGLTWIEPPGISNPLEPDPGGSNYNADPTLYFDGTYLYCYYRNSSAHLYVQRSSDGITWTDKTEILDLISDGDYAVCLQIVAVGSWLFFYGMHSGGLIRIRMTGPMDYLDVSQAVLCPHTDHDNIINNVPGWETQQGDAGDVWRWHYSMKYLNDVYYACWYFKGYNYNNKLLLLYQSTDGVNFTSSQYPLMSIFRDINLNSDVGNFAWDMGWYKPEIIPYLDNEVLKFKLWYVGIEKKTGGKEYFYQGFTTLELKTCGLDLGEDSTINSQRTQELIDGNNLDEGFIFCDDCNRNNEVLNISSCGEAWNISEGQFSIVDNYILNSRNGIPATAYSSMLFTSVPADFELIFQWLFVTVGSGSDTFPALYPIFGSGDGYVVMWTGDYASIPMQLYNGSYLTLGDALRMFESDRLCEYRIRMQSNVITLWINGQKMYTYTFTVADFADQAEMDAILGGGQIRFRFPNNSDDKIKNITLKSL